MLDLLCPSGVVVAVDSAPQVFGRSHIGSAADNNVSREQFEVAVVDGVDDVLQLRVLGKNGIVETLLTITVQ